MNYLKRAWFSVARRTSKSLILLVVVFILGNVMAVSVSIQQASNQVETVIKQQLGVLASVIIDWEALYEKWEQLGSTATDDDWAIDYLSMETIAQIAALPYVQYHDYSFYTSLQTAEYKRVNMDSWYDETEEYTYFEFKGVQYPAVLDVEQGKIQVTDGRAFTQQDIDNAGRGILISEKMAETNNLSIGDRPVFKSLVQEYDETTWESTIVRELDVPFEVIGIFKPLVFENDSSSTTPNNDNEWIANLYDNQIYAANSTLIQEAKYLYEAYLEISPESVSVDGNGNPISFEELYLPNLTPYFMLNSPDDTESFRDDVSLMIPEYYRVMIASDNYDSIAAPIQSMSSLFRFVLIASIAASVLILSLVIILFLRDRKHELGIYLSLGDRRSKVVSQIILEVLIVAFIGISLSLFSGNLIAKGVSNQMIQNHINQNSDDTDVWTDIGWVDPMDPLSPNLDQDDVVAAYKITLSLNYILLFYGIGLGVALLSTAVPTLYITRLNPRKIMM